MLVRLILKSETNFLLVTAGSASNKDHTGKVECLSNSSLFINWAEILGLKPLGMSFIFSQEPRSTL